MLKSTTDKELPKRVPPHTETAEPSLAKLRTDTVEPREAKLRIAREEPIRAKLLTDIALPTVKNPKTERLNTEPMRTTPSTDTVDPNLA